MFRMHQSLYVWLWLTVIIIELCTCVKNVQNGWKTWKQKNNVPLKFRRFPVWINCMRDGRLFLRKWKSKAWIEKAVWCWKKVHFMVVIEKVHVLSECPQGSSVSTGAMLLWSVSWRAGGRFLCFCQSLTADWNLESAQGFSVSKAICFYLVLSCWVWSAVPFLTAVLVSWKNNK